GKLYAIMEICRVFDQNYKEHLDGMYVRPGGEKIYNVFDSQLPAALKRLQFDKHLSMENVRKTVTEADGYQPHLIAPEQGYRRLIESSVVSIRGPAESAVHAILKDLVHKAINETHVAFSYPFVLIGTTVLAYVNMVCASLRNSIPKSIVYCQVREAKRSLLDHFFTDLGKREVRVCRVFNLLAVSWCVIDFVAICLYSSLLVFLEICLQGKQLGKLLDEDPAIMERRTALAKRLELYRSAQAEIDAVAWTNK
ncbi:hypothetical protein BHE74_00050727, partial [Ensete ventricosum]